MLASFTLSVSHQEIERILSEIEAWYECAHEQAGLEWLPSAGIENFLQHDLGYEDMDEFEDALNGSFKDFLSCFPHIEVKEEGGKMYLKVNIQTPGPPRRMQVKVEKSSQLLDTTLIKVVDAEIEFPHLEFTICGDQKRHIDSLYQHIVSARDNLENHCQALGENSEDRAKIALLIEALTSALDVETPYEIIIHDPTSLCEIDPADAVVILPVA